MEPLIAGRSTVAFEPAEPRVGLEGLESRFPDEELRAKRGRSLKHKELAGPVHGHACFALRAVEGHEGPCSVGCFFEGPSALARAFPQSVDQKNSHPARARHGFSTLLFWAGARARRRLRRAEPGRLSRDPRAGRSGRSCPPHGSPMSIPLDSRTPRWSVRGFNRAVPLPTQVSAFVWTPLKNSF